MLDMAFPFIYILMSCFIGVKKIPTACITIEDAEMMARMAARGTKIIVNLKMEAQNLPPVISRNTVAEIKGSVYPEQVSAFQNFLLGWDNWPQSNGIGLGPVTSL